MAVLLRDIIANGLCVVNVKRSESESESESKYRPVAQISLSLICPPGLLLVGVATPNPPLGRCIRTGPYVYSTKVDVGID